MSFPSQSIHISLPDASILVDANNYALAVPPGSPYLPQQYKPPPNLLDQLLVQGIHPADITHLVITHAHFDHYFGTTTEREGTFLPTFPNARYYLGRADWEDPDMQTSLLDPHSIDSRTFGVLHRYSLLELVEDIRDLTPAVRIIAAPGESSGHQIVRVHSARRHTLAEVTLSENTLLVAAHMLIGRLQRTSSGITWADV